MWPWPGDRLALSLLSEERLPVGFGFSRAFPLLFCPHSQASLFLGSSQQPKLTHDLPPQLTQLPLNGRSRRRRRRLSFSFFPVASFSFKSRVRKDVGSPETGALCEKKMGTPTAETVVARGMIFCRVEPKTTPPFLDLDLLRFA